MAENVKALVTLARMVLMIWLGAVDERWKPVIKDLVPRGLENIKYLGLAGDNPLAINFKRAKVDSISGEGFSLVVQVSFNSELGSEILPMYSHDACN
jgi:hypothetical protein